MTVMQFRKKVAVARKCGSAVMKRDGCVYVLYFHDTFWALWNETTHNCVTTAYHAEDLEYLFE